MGRRASDRPLRGYSPEWLPKSTPCQELILPKTDLRTILNGDTETFLILPDVEFFFSFLNFYYHLKCDSMCSYEWIMCFAWLLNEYIYCGYFIRLQSIVIRCYGQLKYHQCFLFLIDEISQVKLPIGNITVLLLIIDYLIIVNVITTIMMPLLCYFQFTYTILL